MDGEGLVGPQVQVIEAIKAKLREEGINGQE